MRKVVSLILLAILILPGQAALKNKVAKAYILTHNKIQKKLLKIENNINSGLTQLNQEFPNLRKLNKKIQNINTKHKELYKRLSNELKISKTLLASVKDNQGSMRISAKKIAQSGDLQTAFELALESNNKLYSLVTDNKANAYTDSTNSGLFGTVTEVTGNCMPGPKHDVTCYSAPKQTTVIVRKATKNVDYTYYAGGDNPVVIQSTNDQGVYHLDLAPGDYSVFVLDDEQKEYCNSFDGQGYACRITVQADLYSEENIIVDKAAH